MRKHGSAAELETRRRLAGQLLLEGRENGEVAEIVGASISSVKRWKRAAKKGGLDALKGKAPSRPQTSSRRKTKTTVVKNPSGRAATCRLQNRSLDLRTCGGDDRQNFSGFLSPLSRLEDSPRLEVDLPEARAASKGMRRSGPTTLARARLAADKKGARESAKPPFFSWMKAASCSSRCAAAPGRLSAKRRCNMLGIATSVCRSSASSASLLLGTICRCISISRRKTSMPNIPSGFCKNYMNIVVVGQSWCGIAGRCIAPPRPYFEKNHPDWFKFEWLPSVFSRVESRRAMLESHEVRRLA